MSDSKPSTNVFSELHPDWIQDEGIIEKDDFWAIIRFYLLYSVCDGQSWKNKSLQGTYGWKKNPWNTTNYLKDRILTAIWPDGDVKIKMAEKKEEYEQKIDGMDLDEDFIVDAHRQRACYVKVSNGNGNGNLIMSFLYHIRNGFAHGRYKVVPVGDTDEMIFLEDGKQCGQRFEVTARIAVLESSLLKIISIIENGPDVEYDYSEEILQEICQGNNTKKGIIEKTGIQEQVWKREIEKLKLTRRVSFVKNKWCQTNR